MVHKSFDRNENIVTPEGRLYFPVWVASTVEGKKVSESGLKRLQTAEDPFHGEPVFNF